jgi:hypothetical protein
VTQITLRKGGAEPGGAPAIDANVMEFAAIDTSNVPVLGGDGKLWWEQAPFGAVSPKHQPVDVTVA